jgi:transposase
MTPIYRRGAGMDIHKKSISVCIRIRAAGDHSETETAVFRTFPRDWQPMAQWLKEHQVRHGAMESTGVYGKPVWNVLEASRWKFDLVLVNPQPVRALPGKKTDRQDAARMAGYWQEGWLRGSFVPPQPTREWRELTRRRTHLEQDRNRVINRMGRLLETAHIKLGSVLSNIVGKSGRAILDAMAPGENKPEVLAGLTVGKVKSSREEFVLALEGRYSDHLRWVLGQLLQELSSLDRRVAEVDLRMGRLAAEHTDLVTRLCTLPAVELITAYTLMAEIGTDMRRFPDARHLASWAGLCPGNQESAGQRFRGRTRKGDRYLRRLLVPNAWAVAHRKDCALTALFYRVAAHQGMKKAALAVAHRIWMLAYYIIRDGTGYREAGGDIYDRRNPQRTAQRLVRRLERIGFEVTVKPKAQPPQNPGPPAGQTCKMCNAWRIACIHVRPRLGVPPEAPSY